jgi:hypothetical protein
MEKARPVMTVRGLLLAVFWFGVCFAFWSAVFNSARSNSTPWLFAGFSAGASALLIGVGAMFGNAWNTAVVVAAAHFVWLAMMGLAAVVLALIG